MGVSPEGNLEKTWNEVIRSDAKERKVSKEPAKDKKT